MKHCRNLAATVCAVLACCTVAFACGADPPVVTVTSGKPFSFPGYFVPARPAQADSLTLQRAFRFGVQPVYPRAPRRAHVGGSFTIGLTLNAEGRVVSAAPYPYPAADPRLVQAALDAVRTWRYDMSQWLEQEVVEVHGPVEFTFDAESGTVEHEYAWAFDPIAEAAAERARQRECRRLPYSSSCFAHETGVRCGVPGGISFTSSLSLRDRIFAPLPDYPLTWKLAGISGDVLFQFDLDQRGRVTALYFNGTWSSTGSPDYPPEFEVLRYWRFVSPDYWGFPPLSYAPLYPPSNYAPLKDRRYVKLHFDLRAGITDVSDGASLALAPSLRFLIFPPPTIHIPPPPPGAKEVPGATNRPTN